MSNTTATTIYFFCTEILRFGNVLLKKFTILYLWLEFCWSEIFKLIELAKIMLLFIVLFHIYAQIFVQNKVVFHKMSYSSAKEKQIIRLLFFQLLQGVFLSGVVTFHGLKSWMFKLFFYQTYRCIQNEWRNPTKTLKLSKIVCGLHYRPSNLDL